MSTTTSIEWATKTWGPIIGCSRVSRGCDECYAINTAHIRSHHPNPKTAAAFAGTTERRDGRIDWTGKVNLLPERLAQPLRWRGPQRIFVNSMSDLFAAEVPDTFIAQILAVMALTPRHTYQVLTKRHARMRSFLARPNLREMVADAAGHMVEDGDTASDTVATGPWPLPNLWMGVSVEDQKTADLRIPALLDTPAAVRWLSCEPLLGPVDLAQSFGGWTPGDDQPWDGDHLRARMVLHWVVVGGESGRHARPMEPDWARALRDQCQKGDIPFFFKQWGGRTAKANGRELDGCTWDEYPAATEAASR